MARPRLVERRMSRFLQKPGSVRMAVSVIVVTTAIVVVGGGVLMWLLDHSEYPNLGRGMWWAMQTVTTVGYGDVTPAHVSGRIVGVVVMLWGIAFLAILVAAITSTFVTRGAHEHELELVEAERLKQQDERLDARFDDLAARLDRVEQLLSRLSNG
jgi:voltage-gated potassium channel Kch